MPSEATAKRGRVVLSGATAAAAGGLSVCGHVRPLPRRDIHGCLAEQLQAASPQDVAPRNGGGIARSHAHVASVRARHGDARIRAAGRCERIHSQTLPADLTSAISHYAQAAKGQA